MKQPDSIIKNLIDLRNEFNCYYKLHGLIGLGTEGIHMGEVDFLDTFSNYTTTVRECEQYPICHETTVDGVKFFCIKKAANT